MFFILTISSIPPRPTKKKKTKRKRKKGRTIIKYFNVNGTEDGKICSSVCVCVCECTGKMSRGFFETGVWNQSTSCQHSGFQGKPLAALPLSQICKNTFLREA